MFSFSQQESFIMSLQKIRELLTCLWIAAKITQSLYTPYTFVTTRCKYLWLR